MEQILQRLIPRKAFNKFSKEDWLCALSLTILAALPRLCRLDLAQFNLDEANHYRMAYRLTRGAWRWVGSTSSIGFPKPPIFIYALALPMTLTRDPRVVTGFLGALAALAVGGFYLILRRLLGRKGALGAGLLFALNPQAVLYSRKLFTADLLPPLCTLFLGAGMALLESRRERIGRWAMLAAFAFALLVMNTFSPLILLPAFGLLFLERRRDLQIRHWLGTTIAFTLPLAPYLIKVAPRIPSAVASVGGASSSSLSIPKLLKWLWSLLYGVPWPSPLLSLAGVGGFALALLSLGGLGFLFDQARRGESGRWARFSLAWLLLAPLLALAAPIEIHPHYLVCLYPALFVIPAAGVELVDRRKALLGWIALLLLLGTAVWQVQNWRSFLHSAATGSEGYGTPLGYWWRAAQRARALVKQEEASEVLLMVPGGHSWNARANILNALLGDAPHRVVDGHTTVVYPPERAIFMIAPEVESAAAPAIPCTQDLEADLTASPFGGVYHYRLWAPTRTEVTSCPEVLQPANARWASGARLLGYRVVGTPKPGEVLQVSLCWETTRGPLEIDVHWFNHLQDDKERLWGQRDLVGWPAKRWRPGDRVLLHFDLSIAPDEAPGPYVLRVGQYSYPAIENIPVVDAAGNPIDHAATLEVPAK